MKREEFLQLYPLPTDENFVAINTEKLIESVRVKSIYNYMLNAQRESLIKADPDYYQELVSTWSNAVDSALKQAKSDKTVEEAIEKSKVIKELIKRGYHVTSELHIIPVVSYAGDTHHYNVYVSFYANVQSLLTYWKNENAKRKVFIFVEDGVFQMEYPPYNLKHESPYGFIGVDAKEDTLIICD